MSIEEHGKVLEEAFFAKKNRELLEKVKAELDTKTKRDALKAATGISADTVLDGLMGIGVTAESLTALGIAPMVLVAWADGTISAKESEAVISAAEKAGVEADSTARQLLQGWLEEKPSDDLAESWKAYVAAIKQKLPAGDQVKLGEQIMARCKTVAESAGGFLGLGSVSAKETAMLKMLQSVLD